MSPVCYHDKWPKSTKQRITDLTSSWTVFYQVVGVGLQHRHPIMIRAKKFGLLFHWFKKTYRLIKSSRWTPNRTLKNIIFKTKVKERIYLTKLPKFRAQNYKSNVHRRNEVALVKSEDLPVHKFLRTGHSTAPEICLNVESFKNKAPFQLFAPIQICRKNYDKLVSKGDLTLPRIQILRTSYFAVVLIKQT